MIQPTPDLGAVVARLEKVERSKAKVPMSASRVSGSRTRLTQFCCEVQAQDFLLI
jgi:hypothetical protein